MATPHDVQLEFPPHDVTKTADGRHVGERMRVGVPER